MCCGRKLDGVCTINRIGEWLKTKMLFRENTHRKNKANYDGDNSVLILRITRNLETALRHSPELGRKCHHKCIFHKEEQKQQSLDPS
jgi:hypothetical protein